MPTLAAYATMMQRGRNREGLRVCRAAWLLGLTECTAAWVLGLVLVAAILAACTSSTASGSPGSPRAVVSGASSPTTSPAPISMADARDCPVTIPKGKAPSAGRYGDAKLSVTLWPHGVITAGGAYVTRRGKIRMKFPWWRGVRGRLRITGHRIDASAPPLRTQVPHGYGRTGFQASGVTFPTEGCWRVTGSVGSTRLTFVTFVIRR